MQRAEGGVFQTETNVRTRLSCRNELGAFEEGKRPTWLEKNEMESER